MEERGLVVEVHSQVVELTKDLLRVSLTDRNHIGPKVQKELDLVMNTSPLSEREIAARQEG